MNASSDNAVRYVPGTRGHVESFFMRANHPSRPLAVWLKATIFAPEQGDTVAELWCTVFDGEHHRVWADKKTVPVAEAGLPASGEIEIAGARFDLSDSGHAVGRLGEGKSGCSWELEWSSPDPELGAPLRIYPYPVMYRAPLPKFKLLTPHPVLRFDGTLNVWGQRIDVDKWHGMQGHNWGREHAIEYAWGQCNFPGANGDPACSVEGFTGRIKLGPITTPMFSAMVVRRAGREYRFDRTFDFWRQQADIDDMRWTLRLQGSGGEAHLEMEAAARDMACLRYQNPNGRPSFCFNSKLASTRLRVNPINADGFECASPHGGALEFLRPQPDPRFDRVV